VRALTISDKVEDFIYSPAVKHRYAHVDAVISCGDLPYYYLEYLVSVLNKPLYYVRGNHASPIEYGERTERSEPWGAINLDRTQVHAHDLIMMGLEGSIRYNEGPVQYSNDEMRWRVLGLMPTLFLNRAIHGRYLDVLVTHSPPRGVQDAEDPPHRGFTVFNWFLRRFRPRTMLHGHIHVYTPQTVTHSVYHHTDVINCYGYGEIELLPLPRRATTPAPTATPPPSGLVHDHRYRQVREKDG
jgi:hypothetical protein